MSTKMSLNSDQFKNINSRGMKNNPYIDLLSSDQDQPQPSIASLSLSNSLPETNGHSQSRGNTSLPPTPARVTKPQKLVKVQQQLISSRGIRYQDIINFRSLMETTKLINHYFSIRDFLQETTKNVLFIFGPSGCGKTLLLENALTRNVIPYQFAVGKEMEDEEGEIEYEDIFSILQKYFCLNSVLRQQVILFRQFPLATPQCPNNYLSKLKIFRENVYNMIQKCHNRNKYIFLLNTEIYSPFFILNENSQSKALQILKNVSVIKMEAYGVNDMKKIVQHFVKQHPLYASAISNQIQHDQLIIQANGDARKALHLLYHRKQIQQARGIPALARSQPYVCTKSKSDEKDEQKVTIFHMLGKFLYGKRLNIYHNPSNRRKKDNEASSYYSEVQLARLDPPFYFKPVELFDRSNMTLNVFSEYFCVQTAYLRKTSYRGSGKLMTLQECTKCSADGVRYDTLREMQQVIKELMTWGILIYNRNSPKEKGLFRIQRSRNTVSSRLAKQKRQIIKSHFLRIKDSTPYRMSDILQFATYTKTDRYKNEYSPIHQKLISLVNDVRRSSLVSQAEVESNVSVIQDEEEDLARENCSRVNQIESAIAAQIRKKQRIIAMAFEDSDESDIDSNQENH